MLYIRFSCFDTDTTFNQAFCQAPVSSVRMYRQVITKINK